MILKKFTQPQFLQHFFQIVGLATAYFIAGKIGNLLAIPPDYATVIFPSAGIALAGVLLYGKRVGWGVLLGTFLLNLTIPIASTHLSEILNSQLVNLAIACGATLQALFGAYLVRRFAGMPYILSNKKNILLFLFYGGFVSALVNSTFSISLLVEMGRLSKEAYFENWLSWSIGDALGIIIFTPLVLVWFSEENPIWQSRKLEITLPILILFFLTACAIFYDIKASEAQLKTEFTQRANQLSFVLESSINNNLNILRSFRSFYSASSLVERREFQIFSEEHLKNFKGVQAVQWVPIILDVNRDAYEKSVRQEGFPNFQITERDANNKMVRAGIRAEYAPVAFNEPYKGNEIVSGFDNFSNALQQETIDRARDINDISASKPIKLLQETGTQKGFVAYIPIYHANQPVDTLQERRNAIKGYIAIVFRAGDMIKTAFGNQNLTDLSYRLIDISAPIDAQILFINNDQEFKTATSKQYAKTFVSLTTFNIGGQSWQFEILPTANYFIQHTAKNISLILMVGFILIIMTIINTLMSAIRDSEEKRTTELMILNDKLEIQIAEKEKWANELSLSHAKKQNVESSN